MFADRIIEAGTLEVPPGAGSSPESGGTEKDSVEIEPLGIHAEVQWERFKIHLTVVEEPREIITGTLKILGCFDDLGIQIVPGVHRGGLPPG